MMLLRKGDRGEAVKELQEMLKAKGINVIPDRIFGYRTELAVKQYQARNGLYPDGIVGRKTFISLGKRVQTRAPQPPIGGVAGRQHAGVMNLSESGIAFLFRREAAPGISCYLHFPGGSSGVTLGPGYDMKHRTTSEIKERMISLGLDINTAEQISKASGVSGIPARTFAENNHALVKLSASQEIELLKLTVPNYIRSVKNRIFVNLTQYEFDALVSFAYNPASSLDAVCSFINQGRISDAMDLIKRIVLSGGSKSKGLINRRRYEVDLYLKGIYG
ncbi:GH24 family phage-related lysozyme (muramidase) [Erwinia toletana]|uniref:Lysozyme n=1 Tax=Winslowiella toletana TaxID=92490 RepID=A0ABS4P9C5_9GAMM|nr:peptidoglycan-binding protein [Winslowiella toletana]MBP2168772.1 GH24 family phage-related lysozyme (muramidase) [Winslowiella toletana]